MMSKNLLTILLFISLAFNLAVLGSVFWLHSQRPKHHPRFHERNDRPQLPEHLQELPWDPSLRDLRQAYDRDRILLMRELAKADYDVQLANALIDSSLSDQAQLEKALAIRFLELRSKMSRAEASEYFEARAAQIERRSNRFSRIHERRKSNEKNDHYKPGAFGGRRRPAGSKSR